MTTIYLPKYLYYKETFHRGMAVAADGDTIIAVGPEEEVKAKYPEAQTERWNDLAMIPGTVNVHNHCFQSLLRGIACDRPFLEWRDNALYKYSPKFRKEDIYSGAVFAFGEMMKYGVTTVSDFFYLHNFGKESDEMIIKAAKDVGIRLVLARTMYDWNGAPAGYVEDVETAYNNTKDLAEKYNGGDQMVTVLPAPHSLHAASTGMVKAGYKLSRELNTCFHIHVAEEPFEVEQVKAEYNGLTPIELLDDIGVVDEHMVIIHGVWLKPSEIETLGKKGGKLAYCPSSNMFLADGITDIPKMMASGVLIGLGSDGACSNNRISIFEEMRMVAMLQKANTCDSMCVNYKDAFKMGTENGGRLLELPVGLIEEGYKADFVGIDTTDISMQPQAIARVVVGGKLTVDENGVRTIPEEKIVEMVRKTMKVLEG